MTRPLQEQPIREYSGSQFVAEPELYLLQKQHFDKLWNLPAGWVRLAIPASRRARKHMLKINNQEFLCVNMADVTHWDQNTP